jgi:hypothetical protein
VTDFCVQLLFRAILLELCDHAMQSAELRSVSQCCSAIGADSGMWTRVITKTGDGELAKLAAYVESVYGTSLELTGGL